MSHGRRSDVLRAAALLPLLAASVLPTQIRTFVCRFTGTVMQLEACCPSDRHEATAPASQLLGENCCLAKVVDLPKLLSEQLADGAPRVRVPALASEATVRDLVAVGRCTSFDSVRPPPHGPPLLLLKRSFLI